VFSVLKRSRRRNSRWARGELHPSDPPPVPFLSQLHLQILVTPGYPSLFTHGSSTSGQNFHRYLFARSYTCSFYHYFTLFLLLLSVRTNLFNMPFPSPILPPAPSWYPGHMHRFIKQLPALLQDTHIVLEARDVRLPLTSINPEFESALDSWRAARGNGTFGLCQRIVVYTKRDLVPKWGEEVRHLPLLNFSFPLQSLTLPLSAV